MMDSYPKHLVDNLIKAVRENLEEVTDNMSKFIEGVDEGAIAGSPNTPCCDSCVKMYDALIALEAYREEKLEKKK